MARIQARPMHADHVTATTLESEVVLYDAHSERVHILNATAAFIWQLCDGELDKTGIAGELAETLGVSRREVIGDVSNVIKQLRAEGLLEYSRAQVALVEPVGS